MDKWLSATAAFLLVGLLAGCSRQVAADAERSEPAIRVDSGGTKYLVDPAKVSSGGPPKDGIPSIDRPEFQSAREADEWLKENELVLAIVHQGQKRVYPAQILVWHEIVNDTIAGDPILITWCPLCGSGIAYERMAPRSWARSPEGG